MHFLSAATIVLVDFMVENGHDLIDLAGLVPGVGDAADLLNGYWYYVEGETGEAYISFGSVGLGALALTRTGDKIEAIINDIVGQTDIKKLIGALEQALNGVPPPPEHMREFHETFIERFWEYAPDPDAENFDDLFDNATALFQWVGEDRTRYKAWELLKSIYTGPGAEDYLIKTLWRR